LPGAKAVAANGSTQSSPFSPTIFPASPSCPACSSSNAPAHFTLAQIAQFKLQQPVHPGDTVETHVTLDKVFGQLAQFDVTLHVGEQEIARGRVVLSQPQS
jgi:3-hydroxymyristoyl/3-hydroxydecanoyl-(acyl carrier protein) dehydratase